VPIPTIPLPSATTDPLRVPYDNRRVSPDEFGASIGRGIEQTANAAANALKPVAQRARDEADVLAAQDAETTWGQETLGKLHGTTDPTTGKFQPGFLQSRGKQSLAVSASLLQDLEQSRQQIASGLVNDRQKRLFLGRTQGLLLGFDRTIETHTGEQVTYLLREGTKTNLEMAISSAAGSVITPAGQVDLVGAEYQVDLSRDWLQVAAEQQAGLDGEDAARFVREGQGTIGQAVMGRLLATGHAEEARTFLEARRDIFDEKKAAEFEHHISTVVENRKSVLAAQAYTKGAVEARDGNGAPLAVDEARAFAALDADLEAGTISPELWKLTREQLRARVSDVKDSAKQVVGTYAAKAMQAFMAPGADGKPRLSLAAVPPDVRAWLTDPTHGDDAAKVWEQLVRWGQTAEERERSLRQLPTPEQAQNFLELHTDMMRHPAKYRAMPPAAFAADWLRNDRLSLRDYNQVADDFARLNQAPNAEELVAPRQMLIDEATDAGLIAREKRRQTSEQATALVELERRVEQEAVRLQALTGKKPDPVELRRFTRGELQKVEVQRLFGLTTAHIPKVEAEVRGEQFIGPAQGPAAPPPSPTPAPRAGKVLVVGPGGRTGYVEEGPGLEKWLKAHPGWKRR
jgi:hypothetical protein